MEDEADKPVELFNQHGVYMRPLHEQTFGIIVINDYPETGRCIEWLPSRVSLVMEAVPQHPEWALVETIGQTPNYNLSSSPVSDKRGASHPCSIKIPFSELKYFVTETKGKEIIFTMNDGSKYSACFQQSNANSFITALRGFALTARSKNDAHKYKVVNEAQASEALDKSFSELNLFGESKTDAAWKFMDSFHHRPYETTLQAFSKVTDFFLYRSDSPTSATATMPAELMSNQDGSRTSDDSRTMDSYEVISQVPALPQRIVKPRREPLDLYKWAPLQDELGKITDVEKAKSLIFQGGIENAMRSEVWKYLLGVYPWDSTYQERQEIRLKRNDEYYQMKLQWKTMTESQEQRFSNFHDRKSLIEKDVNRTDRNLPFFAGENNKNLQLLYDILMTYVMYNFDLGYVQGMNDLLSPLLVVMHNEVDTFWCFVGFMKLVGKNFALDQASMKTQLSQLYNLLSVVEPELATYLDQNDSGNMYFCFRWLLVIFKREFAYNEVMQLWEVLWTGMPCPNYHLLMGVALLDSQKATIIGNKYTFTEILKHINEMSLSFDLNSMLENAEGIYNQLKSSDRLSNAVREIVGLPLIEEPQSSKSSTPTNDDDDDDYLSSGGSITLSSDNGEASYERALTMQYL